MTSIAPVRLRRTLYHRLFGGPILQPLLLLVWVLLLASAVVRGARGQDGGLVARVVVGLVVAAVWTLGATGWAMADERGIRWRSYWPVTVTWSDVRGVAERSYGTGLLGVRVLAVVQTATRRRTIVPAAGRGPLQREFLAQVQELAAGRAGRS